jgi:hypothetical protein
MRRAPAAICVETQSVAFAILAGMPGSNADSPKSRRAPCSECGGGYKNHRIHFEKKLPWVNEDDGSEGYDTYGVAECEGCNTMRFLQISWSTDGPRNDYGDPEEALTVYPSQGPHQSRQSTPVRFRASDPIPLKVFTIYKETHQARDTGALILAGAGLRAIVEALCLSQGIDQGTLQKKIDGLVARGVLAKPQADALHEQRFLGNSALHEIEKPSLSDINDGLQIVDTLLHTIFVLPGHVDRMKKTREAREAKKAADDKTGNGAP